MSNKKKKPVHFWTDGISIDESKVSCLIICLIGGMIFAGFAYLQYQDISSNFTDILIALVWGITGINVASNLDKMMIRREKTKLLEEEKERNLIDTTSNDDPYGDI